MQRGKLREWARRLAGQLNADREDGPWVIVPRDPNDLDTHEAYVKIRLGDDPEQTITVYQSPDFPDDPEKPGKISVSGNYPSFRRDSYPDSKNRPDSIQVGDTRPIKAAANDIGKRLIDPWKKAYAEGLEIVARHRDYENRRNAVFNKTVDDYGGRKTTDRYVEVPIGAGGLTVEINGPEKVDIKLDSIPIDLAYKIIAAVQRLAPPNPCKGCKKGLSQYGTCYNEGCPYYRHNQDMNLTPTAVAELTEEDVFFHDDQWHHVKKVEVLDVSVIVTTKDWPRRAGEELSFNKDAIVQRQS